MNKPNFRGDGFDDYRIRRAQLKRMHRARKRRVFVARQLRGEGLSFAEIADRMGIPESSVRYDLSV